MLLENKTEIFCKYRSDGMELGEQMREKLIELLQQEMCPVLCTASACEYWERENCYDEKLADSLIANGVTVQKHGKWVYNPNANDWGIGAWECSNCRGKNDALPWDNKFNPYAFACSHYCPCCGAKMDAPKDGE